MFGRDTSLTSSLGSTRGGRNKVNTWLTMPTASSERGSSKTAASRGTHHEMNAPPSASAMTSVIRAPSQSAIDPK